MKKLTQLDLLEEATWAGFRKGLGSVGRGLLKTGQIASKVLLPKTYDAISTLHGHGAAISQAAQTVSQKVDKLLKDSGYISENPKGIDNGVTWGKGKYRNYGSVEVKSFEIKMQNGKPVAVLSNKQYPEGENIVILKKEGNKISIIKTPDRVKTPTSQELKAFREYQAQQAKQEPEAQTTTTPTNTSTPTPNTSTPTPNFTNKATINKKT
jgi:hypothetical protein